MFVKATPLHFTPAGIRNIAPGDKVNISSGMGGSFTLHVVSTSKNGMTLRGDRFTPSWLKETNYAFTEVISDIYLLMPSADYGLTSKHLDVAIKAGYHTKEEIIAVISDKADVPESVVKKFLARSFLPKCPSK